MDPGWIAAFGLLTTAAGACIPWLWNKFREKRKDTIDEWKELTHRTQELMEGELGRHRVEIAALKIVLKECESARHAEELRAVKLDKELSIMQFTLQRLQGFVGDTLPPSPFGVVVIADLDGKVKSVSPNVSTLLHYVPSQLVGKNVKILVPQRLHDAHDAGLRAVKDTGKPPWPEKAINTYALTQEGNEVPVTINLTGIPVDSSWLISAELKQRPAEPPQAVAGGS